MFPHPAKSLSSFPSKVDSSSNKTFKISRSLKNDDFISSFHHSVLLYAHSHAIVNNVWTMREFSTTLRALSCHFQQHLDSALTLSHDFHTLSTRFVFPLFQSTSFPFYSIRFKADDHTLVILLKHPFFHKGLAYTLRKSAGFMIMKRHGNWNDSLS